MKSKFYPRWVPLFIVFLACADFAEAGPFRLLAWGAYDLNLQYQSGPKSSEVTAFPGSFSPVYEYREAAPLTFFKMVEHEGKPLRQTACVVTIAPEIQQALIILIPGDDTKALSRKVLPNSQGQVSKESSLIYDYVVIDDSPAAHPADTIVFRNFSRLPIAINIAQQQLTLAPRDKAQVPIISGAKRMSFRAAAQLENGQWRLLSSNPLPISGARRLLVILRDGPANAARDNDPNVAIVPLFDWPSAAPAEAAEMAAPPT